MWWVIGAASWLIIGAVVAPFLGRSIKHADEQALAAAQSAIEAAREQRLRDASSND